MIKWFKYLVIGISFLTSFSAIAEKSYSVGTDATYPPFEFKDENGSPVGFEVELLQAIAKAQGFNLEFLYLNRKEWLDTLNSGKADMFISSLSISNSRLADAEMSNPILQSRQVVYLLDKPENAAITTLADFAGKTFTGNVVSSRTKKMSVELSGSEEHYLPEKSFYLAIRNVWSGKADAMVGDDKVFQYYGLKYPNANLKYRLIPFDTPALDLGIAFKKGNVELKQLIDDGLKKIKENGEYQNLVKKYFGTL